LKKLIIVFTLILILTGCSNSKGPPQTSFDPAISSTVENFLEHVSRNSWDKAFQLLSGEALINARNNVKFKQKKFELLNSIIDVIAYDKNGTYARAIADITVKSGENVDRKFYEFDLLKLYGQWKIYNQREINPELSGLIEESQLPAKIDYTVKTYITLATTGQWSKANNYLTGQALRAAKSNYQGNVQTGLSPGNINIKPIGCQNNVWKIKASYSVNDIKQILALTVVDSEQPKISEITLASRKGV